jgi:16S rRNA (guanine527-N7)-methyltransferase
LTSREFQERLARRARSAQISIPPRLAESLEIYFCLLAQWNHRINLTGLKLDDPEASALDRLLIEPLLAARYAKGVKRMIDIGSGGGSPAIPMALALTPARLLMVESKARKSVFLQEALRALQMDDSRVVTSRYEALLSDSALHEQHDLLTIRAVRVSTGVLNSLQAFVKPGGLVMLFQSGEGGTGAGTTPLTPPLKAARSHRLVDSLQSRLVVLEKAGRDVPRGTSSA